MRAQPGNAATAHGENSRGAAGGPLPPSSGHRLLALPENSRFLPGWRSSRGGGDPAAGKSVHVGQAESGHPPRFLTLSCRQSTATAPRLGPAPCDRHGEGLGGSEVHGSTSQGCFVVFQAAGPWRNTPELSTATGHTPRCGDLHNLQPQRSLRGSPQHGCSRRCLGQLSEVPLSLLWP